ncbi:MAG: hypothetical protein B7Y17_00445 [Sulfuricurvum sp. 24-42-5]|nr:MAG: hypothetical protein B7Y17_00445 [Sulfuricurvum sp. 24-42-5]
MTTISIDNIEYELTSLSDEAKAQIGSIQAVDQKIADLNTQLAIMTTARNAYAQALQPLLPKKKATKPKA